MKRSALRKAPEHLERGTRPSAKRELRSDWLRVKSWGALSEEKERAPARSPSRTSQRYKMAERRSEDRPLQHLLPVLQYGWRGNRRGHDISCPYTGGA